ncbi:glycosyltransferase fused to TPR-repeat domain protein [Lactobacillus amylolyticus DSM 11664]|uniref:Uncharacterized protein n=1 Tax=Lactobacillus amylolyticus DSM 11664 TaxID=585524 RepID=D4YSD3_9LACO|nr:hypothetical protein [Lactobacillus amylolyticus]EFG55948.1 hypothetical protein HMPREF0493_0411 [Lactobacillus amylolyticus DSM 11664]KRL19477.1 glycosyltransferase fused to TPR-repeat domain protein [Lactobacillus amylolyticus DSM 11664]
MLANIEARYARFYYQDNQRDEFEKALNYLNRLSDSKLILLQKLTVKYYQARLEHQSEKAEQIKYLLEISGYQLNSF